jgi:tetratricopeptide (TPR) repeat protein
MSTAEAMAIQAISICEEALAADNHPGFSAWFVQDLTTHLQTVQSAIMYERGDTGAALKLRRRIKEIRSANCRAGNLDDDKWLAAAEGNLAVSLMSEGQPEAAMPLILDLLQRPDMMPNQDLYLNNACVCLLLLEKYDEALDYGFKAMDAARRLRGEDSAQIAM